MAKQRNIPLIDDVGSGLLNRAPNVPWKLELERDESIRLALAEGADLVCFSGDKLLGGPQAGLIVGRTELVQQCRNHPLYRALRVDKMVLAAMEKTLQLYREGRENSLPVWEMLQRTPEECKELAEKISGQIFGSVVERDESFSGGGALPNRSLETFVVVLRENNNRWIAEQLRKGDRPIMVRLTKDSLRIDPRTCSLEEGEYIAQRINILLEKETK